jgi:hypothetical protein
MIATIMKTMIGPIGSTNDRPSSSSAVLIT